MLVLLMPYIRNANLLPGIPHVLRVKGTFSHDEYANRTTVITLCNDVNGVSTVADHNVPFVRGAYSKTFYGSRGQPE